LTGCEVILFEGLVPTTMNVSLGVNSDMNVVLKKNLSSVVGGRIFLVLQLYFSGNVYGSTTEQLEMYIFRDFHKAYYRSRLNEAVK